MESTCPIILNNINYFQWLSYMVDLLICKELYRISPWLESKPIDGDKKAKWENKQDQARGLIGMSIAQDIRFHMKEIESP